jgi:hypothetical protein
MAVNQAVASGDWHTAAKWSSGWVPIATDTVYLAGKAMTLAVDNTTAEALAIYPGTAANAIGTGYISCTGIGCTLTAPTIQAGTSAILRLSGACSNFTLNCETLLKAGGAGGNAVTITTGGRGLITLNVAQVVGSPTAATAAISNSGQNVVVNLTGVKKLTATYTNGFAILNSGCLTINGTPDFTGSTKTVISNTVAMTVIGNIIHNIALSISLIASSNVSGLHIKGNVQGGTVSNAIAISCSLAGATISVCGDVTGGSNTTAHGIAIQNPTVGSYHVGNSYDISGGATAWYLGTPSAPPITDFVMPIKDGNWSDTLTWSSGAVPTSATKVLLTGFVVTVTENAVVDTVILFSVGVLNFLGDASITLTATQSVQSYHRAASIITSGSNVNAIATLIAPSVINLNSTTPILHASVCQLVLGSAENLCHLTASNGSILTQSANAGKTTVYGNVTGGTQMMIFAILQVSPLLEVYGNVTGGNGAMAYGISASSGADISILVVGNIIGGTTATGVRIGANFLEVRGSVTGGSGPGAFGVDFSNGTGTFTQRNGNLSGGASGGTPAISADFVSSILLENVNFIYSASSHPYSGKLPTLQNTSANYIQFGNTRFPFQLPAEKVLKGTDHGSNVVGSLAPHRAINNQSIIKAVA